MATNNNFIYLVLTLLTGALIPIQAATNTAFSKSIGNSSIAGMMVFVVGLIAILLFILISKTPVPPFSQLIHAPLYSYLGGIIIATYVVMITILIPKIGVGTAIGLIVTGQILAAVAIDHFGLFNVVVRAVTITRLIGVVLMIFGVFLVMKKTAA